MPEYLYRCGECKEEQDRRERMFYGTAVLCECGALMHRVPQPIGVNWGGHWACEMHPRANEAFNGAEQRREEMIPNVASQVVLSDGYEL